MWIFVGVSKHTLSIIPPTTTYECIGTHDQYLPEFLRLSDVDEYGSDLAWLRILFYLTFILVGNQYRTFVAISVSESI